MTKVKQKIHLHLEYEHQWLHNPLELIFKIDDRIINYDVTGKTVVTIDKSIALCEGKHRFSLNCHNKTFNHTLVDEHKNIKQDSYAKWINFSIDDIDLMQYVKSHGYFKHQKGEKISPSAGVWANGAWCMDFKTPVYDWLLESLF